MIRKVHVVFKTHLDIGFTDTAEAVENHYLRAFIPAAIRTAEEVNLKGQPPLFVWTVGAYLIDLALRKLPNEEAARLENAVRRGHIAYHALPFTTHSELCSAQLFRAGLGIAKRLDARFGRSTIAAKMSDVPGHTRGIIAPLAESGVRYLHIGINSVAAMPQVPPLFLWKNAAGQRLMVNYTRSYGGLTLIPGHDEALYFVHSNDNSGPPSPESIRACFDSLQKQYPGAEIAASTLDAFARGLEGLRDSLPVIRGEIGDTWIHGVGSDPKKTAALRELDRLSELWEQQGLQAGLETPDGRPLKDAFLEQLLLVCEHTWGMDSKKFLTDYANWTRPDFEAARRRDLLPDGAALGRGYDHLYRFARREFEALKPEGLLWNQRSYSLFEASHAEQRAYLEKALALLPESLRACAEQALEQSGPSPLPQGAPRAEEARLGAFSLRLSDGAVRITRDDRKLLTLRLPLYQETGLENYDRLFTRYLTNIPDNADWAIPDNGKPGAETSDAPRRDVNHLPALMRAALTETGWQLEGAFPEAPVKSAGCPAGFRLLFEERQGELLITLLLFDKHANRKPEALFLPFELGAHEGLRLHKLDEDVAPEDCLPGGNRRSHAIQSLSYTKDGLRVRLTPLDSPLICLDAPRLLDFAGEESKGLVCAALYNNLWGTNFKMWYEEDIVARFLLSIEEKG